MALPQSTKRPHIEYPPLAVVWLSGKAYEAGVEKHLLDGIEVPIYDKAKIVNDCFKFRDKLGKNVAIAALKKYVYLPGLNVDGLIRYARINRVEKVKMPYLEAII